MFKVCLSGHVSRSETCEKGNCNMLTFRQVYKYTSNTYWVNMKRLTDKQTTVIRNFLDLKSCIMMNGKIKIKILGFTSWFQCVKHLTLPWPYLTIGLGCMYYFEIFLVPGDLPSNKPAFSTGSLVDRVCGTIPIPLIVFFNPMWVR